MVEVDKNGWGNYGERWRQHWVMVVEVVVMLVPMVAMLVVMVLMLSNGRGGSDEGGDRG